MQCLIILSISIFILYKHLFNNLFNLVSGVILLAFIPNFITSLSLENNYINFIESQILFGITGSIALISLWVILKNQQC